ncbi:DUF2972 domain-containing protein, partial [Campylobacter insulaenigrae]|uniref:DUF2972 domain-containing protein n=1 Tax=Campylobacter insulaenigrae TaxID=260714 RepID=UPI00215387C2
WLGGHGTGTEALKVFLPVKIPDNFFNYETGIQRYKYALTLLLENSNEKKAIRIKDYNFYDFEKFCKLIQKKVNFIFQVRDYFEIFTCYINHRTKSKNAIYEFNIQDDLNEVFDRFYYFSSGKNKPLELSLENFLSWPIMHKNMGFRTCIIEYSILQVFNNILNVYYIDMKDIIGRNTKDTIKKICNICNLSYKNDFNYDRNIIGDLLVFFPLCLTLDLLIDNSKIKILLVSFDEEFDSNLYKDICSIIFSESGEKLYRILIEKKYYKNIIEECQIEYLKLFFKKFDIQLKDTIEHHKKIRIKPEDYLKVYREDKERRIKLREMMQYELQNIKQHRPDIIASWKYYQEFEKMCKELDGKEDSLKENISNKLI